MTDLTTQAREMIERRVDTGGADQELGYSALSECLNFYMSDDADSWRVEKEVVYDAISLASDMAHARVPCPKVFSHGGDAITFTWKGIGAVTVGDPQLGWSYFGDAIKENRYSSFPSNEACCKFLATLFTPQGGMNGQE